jgi:GWxTD domain-containing protein
VERLLREAEIAPETSLLRRLLIVAILMPLAVLAASLWHVRAEAVAFPPLALTLPHQNPQVPQSVPVPAQLVPTAAPQAAGPPQATQYLARWLDQEVPDIATVEEQNGFQNLRTDEEREKFIESFWLRRDPTPGTADNEYRNEYYRRIVDANQRFTTTSGVPGWKTDRGRVLFKHGEPDTRVTATRVSLRMEDGSVISLGPVELWRYRYIEGIGNNVELLFVDTARDGNYRLELDPKQKDLIIRAIP